MDGLKRVVQSLMGVAPVITGLAALMLPVWFGAAAIGTLLDFWDWRFGLEVMTQQIGPWLILTTFVIGVLCLSLVAANRFLNGVLAGALIAPLLALVMSSAAFAWKYNIDIRREAAPALLDVTTDIEDPPHFSAGFIARREPGLPTLDYASKTGPQGESVAALQARLHPDLAPLILDLPAADIFPIAMELAHLHGWRIGSASARAGLFEATAEALWFGFKDDIVVRLRTLDDGRTRVDVRSLAREPVHDLGRNAARIRAFQEALRDAVASAPEAPGDAENAVEQGDIQPDGAPEAEAQDAAATSGSG